MLENFFSPVTETVGLAKDLFVWGLITYGVFQMAVIGGIVARTYYTLKIIKQISTLLTQLISDVKDLKTSTAKD